MPGNLLDIPVESVESLWFSVKWSERGEHHRALSENPIISSLEQFSVVQAMIFAPWQQ